jgi:hypothetical protein
MGIGVSLLIIAAGAILTWGVNATAQGLDITAIGVILMVVGLVGLVLSFMFWSTWGGWGRPAYGRSRRTYVEQAPAAASTAYVEAEPAAPVAAYPEGRPAARRRRVVEDEIA